MPSVIDVRALRRRTLYPAELLGHLKYLFILPQEAALVNAALLPLIPQNDRLSQNTGQGSGIFVY